MGVSPKPCYPIKMTSTNSTIILRNLALTFAVAISPNLAAAQVKLQGQFTASQNCDALLSIKKGTNPGNIKITTGTSYTLLGKNKDASLWMTF